MSVTTRFSILLALILGQLLVSTTILGREISFMPRLKDAFSCNLPAPTNLIVTNVTTNSISVDWADVPGAVGYYIIATDAQTGQTYYTNITTASFEAATGLPSATYINIAICAICSNGQYGSYSNITEQTQYVVIDDAVASYPSVNPPINPCNNDFPLPSCFQLESSPTNKTYFKVDYANAGSAIGVYHVNTDPLNTDKRLEYLQGWYFADEGGTPPFYNTQLRTRDILVYYQPNSAASLVPPIFSFNIEYTQDIYMFKICYANSNILIRPASCSSDPKGNGSKPTPTQDPSASETLQAYPNPFKNVLEVALGEAGTQETRLELMDVNGRLVRTETVEAGTYSVSIETRDLAPGVYVLRCQSAAASKTLKVIKQ